VAVLREHGRGDLRDVVGVGERLTDVAAGERDLAPEDRIQQKVLAEVWLNQLERTIVQSAPESASTFSDAWASSSPRPDSSTSRRVPDATARSANEAMASEAPGAARSG
jgi:hypothetical protein